MQLILCRTSLFESAEQHISAVYFGSKTLAEILIDRLSFLPDDARWREDFFPDENLLTRLSGKKDFTVTDSGEMVSTAGRNGEIIEFSGIRIIYPWHLFDVAGVLAEKICSSGDLPVNASVDGNLVIGENTRILPGVYVEGNCVIGKNCRIGPNCYLRGNTFIGDNCHIGQAVEIKNCIIGCNTSIGHLSYAGDSIIGDRVNFGAGTVIGNLRHDGKNHRCMINGFSVDTCRRKFGALVGCGVHTGIHTSIYPGRILSPGTQTLPGEIVKHNL